MIFQVTDMHGTRITYNASNVVGIAETKNGCDIADVNGVVTPVQESYRSVRGYMKKAYAPFASVVTENAE